MQGRGLLLAVAVAAATVAVAGCGSDEQTVRIGVLTDCQGALRGFGDAQLSGAELPFLRRGAHLLAESPGAGVSAIDVGGRRVELVRGCQETGEHAVFIEEARRLLETQRVDVVVGGSSIVTRDLAHRYPDAVFVSTFWDEQEVTLRESAQNLVRLSPDYAQLEAGLGAYAFNELGWRRAAVVAGDQPSGWTGAAAFTAEFCALGGRVVATTYRSTFTGKPDVVARALVTRPDGVATFLNFLDGPGKILGSLVSRLDDPGRLLVWSQTLEDAALMQALGRRLDGVVGTTWLPSSAPSAVLTDYRNRWHAAFPGLPTFIGDQSAVIGYHNSVEATLTALSRVHSRRVRPGLIEQLRRLRVELPGGTVALDRNRQAVRDGYLSRVVAHGRDVTLEPVRLIPHVEQTFGGLLSAAPPPGPGSQPCRTGSPPPWARR